MVLWHCAGRPWYTQKAGYGAPYKLAGVVGDVFGQTYTSVLYKDPLMPKMVGVVWGDFKSIGNVETYVRGYCALLAFVRNSALTDCLPCSGCTNACVSNNFAIRAGMATASSVYASISDGTDVATQAGLEQTFRNLYDAFHT